MFTETVTAWKNLTPIFCRVDKKHYCQERSFLLAPLKIPWVGRDFGWETDVNADENTQLVQTKAKIAAELHYFFTFSQYN